MVIRLSMSMLSDKKYVVFSFSAPGAFQHETT